MRVFGDLETLVMDAVVGALLALAAPGLSAPPAPALGATGLGVTDRVERLLLPPASARLPLATVLAGLSVASSSRRWSLRSPRPASRR